VLAAHLAADARGAQLPETAVDALYVQVYQAQQLIAPVTLAAATKSFEVGGASAVSRSRPCERHWRHARGLASHNTLIDRARMLGDHLGNGVAPERKYTVGQATTA